MSHETNDAKLTDHQYDGIKEYDNPLPNWWLMTFLGTIIFGFIYLVHYTVGGGYTQAQELAEETSQLPKSTGRSWSEEELKAKLSLTENQQAGATIYSQKCASCHGVEGGGLIGPNLCDSFWIHGQGTRVGVVDVISKGVLEKGMPSWEALLTQDELIQVASHVYSFIGKKPQQAKAPEGTEVVTK